MNKRQKILNIKLNLARHPRFNSKCYVCHKKFTKKGGFSYHHLWYNPGQKYYKDFADPLQYNIELKKQVNSNPEQFLLVCSKHHMAIERLKRWNMQTRKRLYKAVDLTR